MESSEQLRAAREEIELALALLELAKVDSAYTRQHLNEAVGLAPGLRQTVKTLFAVR